MKKEYFRIWINGWNVLQSFGEANERPGRKRLFPDFWIKYHLPIAKMLLGNKSDA